MESGRYVQRSTNQISDIITGVELNLRSSGSANITIKNDISTIAKKVEEFVGSVNFVMEYVREETKYEEGDTPETSKSGIMIGNYVFTMVYNRIRSILTTSVPGLDDSTSTYTLLSQIGIATDPNNKGYFKVDPSKLNAALSSDLDAVAKLFIKDTDSGVNGVAELMRTETNNLSESTTGPMNVLIKNYNGIISGINKKIEKEEKRVNLVEIRLKARFARLESTLAVLNQKQKQLESQIEKLGTK